MLNEEKNNLEVNSEVVQSTVSLDTPVNSQEDVEDIEILDFDDEEEVLEEVKPVEENIQNISEMSSIPSIEEVLGEEIAPAPVQDTTVDISSVEIPVVETPEVTPVASSTEALPSLDELFQTPTIEKPVSAPVEPVVPSAPQEPVAANTAMPSIEEMFGTSATPVEAPKEEAPFTATEHGIFGSPVSSVNNTTVEDVKPIVETPVVEESKTVEIPQMSDIFGIGKPQINVTPVVEEPVVSPVQEMEDTVLPTPVTFDEKEEKVVEKLENTDMTLSKEEKKEDLENTILLNKQLNDAKMAIKAEEAKKDPEKKNQKGIAFVILLFTILLFAVVIIPFIFNFLNK